ncbi:MAG: DNA translocase FtsK [Spirochaetales bacterium]|jgi:S-DNA-T family DNA segregation ATPase FtsK/SpoIIIE|nr:DNA translocase FtsK [Spirochaetales bacterium]
MKLRGLSWFFSTILTLAGVWCMACLAVYFMTGTAAAPGQLTPGAAVGRFFFRSFHYAAFFIPLYFCACAFFLLQKPFYPERLLVLNYLILPFLTLSICLRLFAGFALEASPVTVFFVNSFSALGGAILTALLFLLELSLMPVASTFLRDKLHTFFPPQETKELILLDAPAEEKARLRNHEFVRIAPEDSVITQRLEEEGSFFSVGGIKMLYGGRFTAMYDEDSGKGETCVIYGNFTPPRAEEAPPQENGIEIVGIEIVDEELPEDTPEEEDPCAETEITAGLEADTEAEIDAEIEAEAENSAAGIEAGAGPEERRPAPSPPRSEPRPRSLKKKAYHVPVEGLLTEYSGGRYWEVDDETRLSGDVLRSTLEEFKIQADVVGIRKGPVITMFEILPAPGVKLSKIVNLADNIALRLAASSVRIVAPIPGKHAVGIEIPNKHRAIVSFAELISAEKFSAVKMEIPLALGKDITGEAQIIDLVGTPHLLIAGATGSGKSVCVNSIICSILYRRSPEEVKLILIDPKIVELKFYNDVPHLLTPVITEPKKAFQALQYAIYEMERRYALLDSLGVRDIRSYNRKIKAKNIATTPLPYLVIIIDEFADLMATTGKELESTLARLAAMSRAVGIHLILATQRPSIDVITGLIKANIPSRIAFMVAGKFDSRIIIDAVGAEKLLGRGDMLFAPSWDPFPVRMQGAYLTEEEVEKVVDYVKTLGEPEYIDDEIFIDDEEEEFFEDDEEDPLLDKAIEIVTTSNKASASYLQRRLKIGYNRAARMVEIMERRGIVSPQDGSKARRVLSAAS